VHVGHSTGGGEVVHYIARHGESRVAKAAILSAVPPLMVKTAANPGGLPRRVRWLAGAARSQPGAILLRPAGRTVLWLQPARRESVRGVIWNWWRQGMMGGAKAHYDGSSLFPDRLHRGPEEDYGAGPGDACDDDQIVPMPTRHRCRKAAEERTLKTYKGFPHGMPTTEADTINADLLAFITASVPFRRSYHLAACTFTNVGTKDTSKSMILVWLCIDVPMKDSPQILIGRQMRHTRDGAVPGPRLGAGLTVFSPQGRQRCARMMRLIGWSGMARASRSTASRIATR